MRLLVAVALLSLLAGCTDFSPPPPDNRAGIANVDVAAPVVTAGRVGLDILTTLENRGAESGDLNLTVKAYDRSTSMLVARVLAPVGILAADQDRDVTIRIEVARSGSYNIEITLEEDGNRVQNAYVDLSNLESLEPNLHDANLRVSGIDVEITGLVEGRAEVRVPVYVTNEGGDNSSPLRLQVKARDVETSILADETWADLAPIAPDATRAATVTMRMPDARNYILEVIVWDGEVMVERGQGQVQFLPSFIVPRGSELEVSDPDISQFIDDSTYDYADDTTDDGYDYDSEPKTPGPALPILAVAILAAVLVIRRKTHE